MANYDYQAVLNAPSGLPRDAFVNTFHFSVNAPDTPEGRCDDIRDAYQALAPLMSSDFASLTVKVYEAGPNPSGPLATRNYAVAGTASKSPSQLACCLSYATVDDPEGSLPRRRGRVYLGPISGALLNNPRPPQPTMDALLDFGTALASAGTAGNTTWVMYSQRDAQYVKIESIWVDDSWDVQRRRGLRPTRRSVRDVQ